MAIAFLPFPTAVLGSYFHSGLAGVFYGLSLFAPSAVGAILWFYSRRRGLLGELPGRTRRQLEARAIAAPMLFLLGAGAALLDISLAIVCWTVLLPLTRLFFSLWLQ